MIKLHTLCFLTGIMGIALFGCLNPYFPDTGTPSLDRSLMDTPEKTIARLKEVYEDKDYFFFRDSLIYNSQEFIYYIQDNFSPEDKLLSYTDRVAIDGSEFVPNDIYLYSNYTKEINSHKKLFDSRNEIVFSQPFTVAKIRYDIDDQTQDTLDAYLWTDQTEISISSDVIFSYYGVRTYTFDVGPQVFRLRKSTDGQWRIYQWFELN